ncbi:MAG: DUF4139 domain-containing protein [Pontibacterium sp.]
MRASLIGMSALLMTTTSLNALSVSADESLVVDVKQRQALGITIYNQNLALVRDARLLPRLPPRKNVSIQDVSRQLQPETLRIKNAGTVLEQNFNARLLSRQALLEYYLNKDVQLARLNPATGEETIDKVRLLSLDGNQVLVSRNQQVESIPLNAQWRFIFPTRPPQLLTQPSLSFRSQGTAAEQSAQISYLTGGLSWKMDYVLNLNKAGNSASLSGMATLSNQSGTRYPDAEVQLMAGLVQSPRPVRQYKSSPAEVMSVMADARSVAPAQMEAFHLYNLPEKVDMETGQQKQIALISSDKLNIERSYHHSFYVNAHQDSQKHRLKPNLHLSFKNNKKDGLGQPMPAGNIRVFRPDNKDIIQFVGGAQIGHKSANDPIQVVLGQAFDISIERRQTQFNKNFNGHLVAQEIRISNSREQAATVILSARFSHPWTLKNSSFPMEKLNSGAAQWAIKVPGKSDQLLNFSVQLKTKKK